MPEKCKDCCSCLFCMSVAEVSGEDFETMANKKDCRKRVFTNADRIRAMSDEELAWELMTWRLETEAKHCGIESNYPNTQKTILEWLKQPTKQEGRTCLTKESSVKSQG